MKKKDWRFRTKRGLWMAADSIARTIQPIWLAIQGDKYRKNPVFSPVFIIGAPRSGTTLIYQAFIYYFEIAYMTNLMAELYHAPYLATECSKLAPPVRNFDSSYGTTNGFWGPHESAEFWYQWFPKSPDIYVGSQQLPQSPKGNMRSVISQMSQIAQNHLVFKNTFHSMRINPLLETFPEAVFIVCRRDLAQTAHSILKARIRNFGNPNQWWSVPPREYEEITKHPYWDQVVEQVYYINNQIDQDRQIAPDRFVDISYHEFCLQPNKIFTHIGKTLSQKGIRIKKRQVEPLQPFTMHSHHVDKRILKKAQEL